MVRFFLRVMTVALAIPFFYLIFGLVGGLIPGPVAPIAADAGEVRIGLARGPIHYDFLLPIDSTLMDRFDFVEAAGVPLSHPRARWMVLGWGAAEFYTSTAELGDILMGPVAHAITGDKAVLRVDVAGPADGVPGVSFITLNNAQYQALLTGIEASFARDAVGAPMPVNTAGLSTTDAFFAAQGQFNIFYTCNTWIGRQLRGAGVAVGIWTPTRQSVDLSLWRLRLGQ